jgi:RNA polymerase sigma factor (sigma-70 family)
MASTDDLTGQKQFNLTALLHSLVEASKWQLKLRHCFDPSDCANDLANDWTYFGRPVANGHFLILGDKIVVFIPGAVEPEKVLHSLVCYQVKAWKRKCARCRHRLCPIVDDGEDSGSRSYQPVDPVDPTEMLATTVLLQEIFAQIDNADTRRMFEMKFIEDWSEQEIAERLGISQAAVHQRIYRQTQKLRSIFVPVPMKA